MGFVRLVYCCFSDSWWRHDMDMCSASLALCGGNPSFVNNASLPADVSVWISTTYVITLTKNDKNKKENANTSYWRHAAWHGDAFSVTGPLWWLLDSPRKGPVIWCFNSVSLNKLLNKISSLLWFKTQTWRWFDVTALDFFSKWFST